MISNVVGTVVTGENFFDREREVARIWDHLKTDNLLLLAPRRVGKTSLMHHLRDRAAGHHFVATYVSVSDVSTELAFVQKLYEAAQTIAPAKRAVIRLAKGPLGRFIKRIKKLGVLSVSIELGDNAQEQWAELGNALTRVLDQLGERCLLLVDELPIFVLSLLRQDPTGTRARNFLNWFRQLRLDPLASKGVRWLLAGSIGLDTVTQRMRLGDTINDLYLFNDFGAFTPEVADDFLDELGKAYQIRLPLEVKAKICARIGWLIPYHLQIFFAALRDHCGDHGLKASETVVDQVYDSLLLPGKKAYFDYWEQRLVDELGSPEDRHALELLNTIARNPEGESLPILQAALGKRIVDPDERDQKLRYLLDVLQSDGYIVAANGRFQFRSFLLRDYWTRRLLS